MKAPSHLQETSRAFALIVAACVAFGMNYWSLKRSGMVPPFSIFFGPLLLVFGIAGLAHPPILSQWRHASPKLSALRLLLGFLAVIAGALLGLWVWVP